MSDKIKIDNEMAPPGADDNGCPSTERRRLLRAGLATAPVVMTLKSRNVLATGGGEHICIKPSAFSSLAAADMHLSHAVNKDYTCYSPGYWKNWPHPAPYSDKSKSYFLVQAKLKAGCVSAGFSPDYGGLFATKTLQQVLEMGGGDIIALARHTVCSFLTAVANGDDASKVLLTTTQCKDMWSALAGGGTWSPFLGADWNLADTLAYFNYIYGP